MLCTNAPDIFDLIFHVPDAPVNLAAVGFELRLARAPGADPATQLRHFDSASAQPGQHVLQLRQLHLQLALTGAGVFGKDIEDELSAVDHSRVNQFLDIALLRRREVVIEKQQIGRNRGHRAGDFFQLSLSHERGRIWTIPMLQEFAGNFGARADRQ